MVQAVAPPVGGNTVIDCRQGVGEHRPDPGRIHCGRRRESLLAVDGIAVSTGGQAELLQRLEPLLRTDRSVTKQGAQSRKGCSGILQPVYYLA